MPVMGGGEDTNHSSMICDFFKEYLLLIKVKSEEKGVKRSLYYFARVSGISFP